MSARLETHMADTSPGQRRKESTVEDQPVRAASRNGQSSMPLTAGHRPHRESSTVGRHVSDQLRQFRRSGYSSPFVRDGRVFRAITPSCRRTYTPTATNPAIDAETKMLHIPIVTS